MSDGSHLNGAATDGFRLVVGTAFLESEGMHAENGAAQRIALAPLTEHLRGPVTQHGGMSEQEIHEMRDLQREKIARIFGRDVAVEFGGAGEIPARARCAPRSDACAPAPRVADVALRRVSAAAIPASQPRSVVVASNAALKQ